MMYLRNLSRLLIALAGVVWSSSASADVFSSAVWASTNRSVSCSIVNLGKKDLPVTLQVIAAADASVLATHNVTLAPGEGDSWGYLGANSLQYCAFRGSFSAKSVRAMGLIQDTTTGGTVLAFPAQ